MQVLKSRNSSILGITKSAIASGEEIQNKKKGIGGQGRVTDVTIDQLQNYAGDSIHRIVQT